MVVITLTYPSGSIVGLASNVADAAILGVTLGLSVLNASLFGPRTSRAMVEKNHQGRVPIVFSLRDIFGKHWADTVRNSRCAEERNRCFGRNEAVETKVLVQPCDGDSLELDCKH